MNDNNNYFYYVQRVLVMGEGAYYYVFTANQELDIYGLEKLEGKNKYGYIYIAYKEEFKGLFGWLHNIIDGGLFGWGRQVVYSNLEELSVRWLLEKHRLNYTMLEPRMQFGVHQ